jgi:hypothetical protein
VPTGNAGGTPENPRGVPGNAVGAHPENVPGPPRRAAEPQQTAKLRARARNTDPGRARKKPRAGAACGGVRRGQFQFRVRPNWPVLPRIRRIRLKPSLLGCEPKQATCAGGLRLTHAPRPKPSPADASPKPPPAKQQPEHAIIRTFTIDLCPRCCCNAAPGTPASPCCAAACAGVSAPRDGRRRTVVSA